MSSCGIFTFLSCAIFLTSIWQAESLCNFPWTNEILQNECDLSKWLPWNCTCCGTDTSTYFLAKRQRGICCKPGEPVQHCLQRCNYNSTADTEYGKCGIACPSPSGVTHCSYVKTTTTTTTTTAAPPTTTSTTTTTTTTTSTTPTPPTTTPTTRTATSTITTPSPTTPLTTIKPIQTTTPSPTTSKTKATTKPTTATASTTSSTATTTTAATSTSTPVSVQTKGDYTNLNVTLHMRRNTVPILAAVIGGCVFSVFLPTCFLCILWKKTRENRNRVRTRKRFFHTSDDVIAAYDDPRLYYNYKT